MHLVTPKFPFAREHGAEPSILNAKLRGQGPVSEVELFDGSKAWVVTQNQLICDTLARDGKDLSADRRQPNYPEIHEGGSKAKEARPTFVNLDDPEHAKQRAILEPAFAPIAVESYRPMMRRIINDVLDKMEQKKGQQPIDLIKEFAAPVPTQIIYQLLGIPESDVDELSKDSEIRASTSRNAAETSNLTLQKYIHDLAELRIKKKENDLVSDLVDHYEKGDLEREDIDALSFLILTAGNAALISTIGMGVIALSQHPEQLEEFKRDPSLAPDVVNEIMRYYTASALNCRRVATHEFKIGGHVIKPGDKVICAVQSGDRDEAVYPNPEKFDIHRKHDPTKLLAFGFGPHRCVAEGISRLQLEMAFTSLFQRFPNLRLAKDPSELTYTPPAQNISVAEVPVYL
ncbi:cytochrome P450 [Rhizodiscina lignyota]|uniref:Cytochrome P450 n=1 Tax=Rhizodiscina lignyota TaxID=1504668 RepID=A0A9P4M9N6_9PEZI|nr:cytochrome P450 [Rhizodiscina lignyota]